MKKFCLALLLLFCGIMSASNLLAQPIVKTHVETGDIEGVLENGLGVFKAIPYAAPPVGDLRWRDPQPAKPWTGVYKADKFGPWPPQPKR